MSFHSTVADLIDFELSKSCLSNIDDIINFNDQWNQLKHHLDPYNLKRIQHHYDIRFIWYCNTGEGHGVQTENEVETCISNSYHSTSLQMRETQNLWNTFYYLNDIIHSQWEWCGLMEEAMIKEAHKKVLKDIKLTNSYTKPGQFSSNPRVTEWNGALYYYQHPENMVDAVILLLDSYNSLFTESVDKVNPSEKFESVFKTVAWFMFEFLDLHPFSDGNGRLARLLCNYVLTSSLGTPFPTPIFNSSYQEFEQVLVKTRTLKDKRPLTSMIIRCQWETWKQFMNDVAI